jgi:hypothetical protein
MISSTYDIILNRSGYLIITLTTHAYTVFTNKKIKKMLLSLSLSLSLYLYLSLSLSLSLSLAVLSLHIVLKTTKYKFHNPLPLSRVHCKALSQLTPKAIWLLFMTVKVVRNGCLKLIKINKYLIKINKYLENSV